MKAKKITINCECGKNSGHPHFSIFEVYGIDATNNKVVVAGRYLNRESAEETANLYRYMRDNEQSETIYTSVWVLEQLVFI
jgi:hypothetical protein